MMQPDYSIAEYPHYPDGPLHQMGGGQTRLRIISKSDGRTYFTETIITKELREQSAVDYVTYMLDMHLHMRADEEVGG